VLPLLRQQQASSRPPPLPPQVVILGALPTLPPPPVVVAVEAQPPALRLLVASSAVLCEVLNYLHVGFDLLHEICVYSSLGPNVHVGKFAFIFMIPNSHCAPCTRLSDVTHFAR